VTVPVGVGPTPLTVAESVTDGPAGDDCVWIVAGCITVVKHSAVEFVCEAESYRVSPEYSARQQYVPTAVVAVVVSDVALPFASSAVAAPTCVPPDVQPFAVTVVGSQRKNVTVPVGVSPVPLTVTRSVADVPGTTPAPVGLELVATVGGWLETVKHSFVALVCVAGS
jgi:hypothetical protein